MDNSLKTKYLRKTATERGKRDGNKTQPKTPDSLRQEASQAASAAPTLRYGPAGDSRPSATARPPPSLPSRILGSVLTVKGSLRRA